MFINKNMTKIFLKIRKCSFSFSYKYTYIFLWLGNMLLTYYCKSRIIFFCGGKFWQIYLRAAAAAVKGNYYVLWKFLLAGWGIYRCRGQQSLAWCFDFWKQFKFFFTAHCLPKPALSTNVEPRRRCCYSKENCMQ